MVFILGKVIHRHSPQTAKKLKADRFWGLKPDIDDYITKHFGANELALRMPNILHLSSK